MSDDVRGARPWTELSREDRENRILKGLERGGTLRGLAREFGASESAVIGQWHRMTKRNPGLSIDLAREGGKQSSFSAGQNPSRMPASSGAEKPRRSAVARRVEDAAARRPSQPMAPVSPPPPPRPRPAPPPARPIPVEVVSPEQIRLGAISLLEARENQCRSIVGEVSSLMVCGRPTDPGRSFCPHHCRIYYEPLPGRGDPASRARLAGRPVQAKPTVPIERG